MRQSEATECVSVLAEGILTQEQAASPPGQSCRTLASGRSRVGLEPQLSDVRVCRNCQGILLKIPSPEVQGGL